MPSQTQMIKYINIARLSPSHYIALIDKQIQSFITEKEMAITNEMIYETNQGKQLWRQTKNYLSKQPKLAPFQIHQGLNLSAKDHASDLATHNTFGHTGSDKSSFSERILRYCKKGQGAMAQIIGADFSLEGRNNAEMTVLGLIIDDGVADRGHRKTIFNPEYRYIGCKSEVQGDKVITVFNITQNKLKLRGQPESSGQFRFGSSTMSLLKPNVSSIANLSKTQNSNFKKETPSKRAVQQAFGQLTQNVSPKHSSQNLSKLGPAKSSKKVSERKQNTRIYYEQGAKVTEKHTQIYYSDGTMQQNIEKHTVYS